MIIHCLEQFLWFENIFLAYLPKKLWGILAVHIGCIAILLLFHNILSNYWNHFSVRNQPGRATYLFSQWLYWPLQHDYTLPWTISLVSNYFLAYLHMKLWGKKTEVKLSSIFLWKIPFRCVLERCAATNTTNVSGIFPGINLLDGKEFSLKSYPPNLCILCISKFQPCIS